MMGVTCVCENPESTTRHASAGVEGDEVEVEVEEGWRLLMLFQETRVGPERC